jgi:hypothetical protein
MLANRMMGDSSNDKNSFEAQSSEPHVVVDCPSCRTKFAVESSLVASYETPKFHCSRCDSVFELQPKHTTHSTPQPSKSSSQRWVLADNSDTNTPNPFVQPTAHTRPSESSIKATDFTLGTPASQATLEPRKPFAPLEERAGLSLLGLRPSAGSTVASSILTRQQTLSQMPEHTADTASPEEDPFALFDPPSASSPSASVSLNSITTTPTAETLSSEPQTLKESTPPTPAKIKVPELPTTPHTERTVPTHPERSEQASSQRRWHWGRMRQLGSAAIARLSERNQNLTRISLPVLSTVAVMCVLGYTARLMPQTLDSIFGTAVPSLITGKISHLPDPSLQVQQVTLDFEKTLSKETIPVVRGVINNTADSSIESVLIEALGFNARGEVVVRAQAPLRSALAREKIADLPIDTVRKFQTSLSARNSTIGAGEKVAFTIALISESGIPHDVHYFSARIFSVGKTR